MICRACHTATPDEEIECMHCGFQNKPNIKRNVTITIGLLASVVILSVLFFLVDKKIIAGEKNLALLEEAEERSKQGVEPEAETAVVDENKYTDPLELVWEDLHLWYGALDSYLVAHDSPYILSKNGFLYNYETEAYILQKDLEKTHMPLQEPSRAIYILRMPLEPLKNFEEYTGGTTGTAIVIATEITEGLALYSANNQSVNQGINQGIIYRENYATWLENRKVLISPIERPNATSTVYKDILNTMEGETATMVPRYLAADDNFAFLAYSIIKDKQILYVLLEKEPEGSWKLALEIQTRNRLDMYTEIFKYSSQVNESLIPKTKFLDTVTKDTDNEAIRKILEATPRSNTPRDSSFIEPGEKFLFISYDTDVFVVETANKILAGVKMDTWQVKEVDSFLEAEIFIQINMENPSLLHIHQQ